MTKGQNFIWTLDGSPPRIEAHTERKLEVIKQYLDLYFDTITANPRMDILQITFVDGFCGGGTYQRDGKLYYGSPFMLLNAVKDARFRVNIDRKKPLEIKSQFFFSDLNKAHMEILHGEILKSEFADDVGKSIILQIGAFEEILPNVIKNITRRQRRGRSFFVLDQCGYLGVSIHCLQQIFKKLDKSEAILTFSIDALLNYLRSDGTGLDKLRQFGVNDEFVSAWNELKDDDIFGRATAQRMIMNDIHKNSGATFFTPFMTRSNTDNRWMLLAHLSNHQAARDKMLHVHWDQQNYFRHIGRGSFYVLGFDNKLIESRDALFSFHAEDEKIVKEELENELLSIVIENMTNNVLPVSHLLSNIGNLTAAKNELLFSVLQEFAKEGELEIQKKDGGRKRKSTMIKVTDNLTLPSQRSFFSKYS